MKDLLKQISNIKDFDEMAIVINALNKRQKQLRALVTNNVKKSLKIGDSVLARGTHGEKMPATLVEIRRTRAVIRIDGDLFNCRLSQLEAA